MFFLEMDDGNNVLFQFLIGRLDTAYGKPTQPLAGEFQFLIGRLDTESPANTI